jgi:membrane associated rhomboid family serine protease
VIPLHDNVPTRRRPVVTIALIAINIAIFLVEVYGPVQHLPTTHGKVFRVDLGANAPFIVHHVPVLLTIFTAMFLHGGWAHVGFNMLFLWIFGNNVEDRLGRPRFLIFYLLGGVAAIGLQWLASRGSDVPTIGASGAIAAVLAGYLVLYPRAMVITLIGWIPVPLPAMLFLVVWILLQVVGASAGMGSVGSEAGGVAYFAHVGGFAFGLLTVKLFDRGVPP